MRVSPSVECWLVLAWARWIAGLDITSFFLTVYFKSHHLPQAVVSISHTNTSSKTFVHSQTGLCSPSHIINVNSKTLWPAVVQISTCGAITHTQTWPLPYSASISYQYTHDLKHVLIHTPPHTCIIMDTYTHLAILYILTRCSLSCDPKPLGLHEVTGSQGQ